VEKKYIEIDIADLIPYDRNPRRNDMAVDDVAESMEQVGYITPIVIDENRQILAGETRCKALKKRHVKRDKVLQVFGLTEEQKKKYRLLDNKVGEIAEWDAELLAGELEEVDFGDFDFGFDDLMAELTDSSDISDNPLSPAVEDDHELVLPDEPKSKRGDIYQLGAHRLMCGDSTDPADVARLMGGAQADLLLTDPPYNVNYEGGTGLTIQNDNMEDAEFRKFLRDAFQCADGAMKPGAAFYIWHADSEGYNFRGACHDIGWQVRQCLIWNKNALVLGRQDYQWKHEPCLYGWKAGAAHTWLNDRTQTTVLDFDKPSRSDIHPTMKPIGLFDYQIRNSCPAGGAVLDLFNGSGTTIMACEQNGRSAYCMELDPRYVDAAIERWESFTGGKAVLVNE
jgi:site-specific DNA-methyltransferase (adenine-specific)